VFDLKRPEGWPEPLVRLAAWLNRPYGVSLDLADRHPWESIRSALREVVFQNLYGGMLYLSVGEAR
jgi:demethylmenaquinone methyltransferase/2-methoxy-6-polyprenyl-1,4-benzoquinol methylase